MDIIGYVGCGIFGLVVVATVIVAITKSKSDDTVMGKILDFLGKYVSMIMTARQKELWKTCPYGKTSYWRCSHSPVW